MKDEWRAYIDGHTNNKINKKDFVASPTSEMFPYKEDFISHWLPHFNC